MAAYDLKTLESRVDFVSGLLSLAFKVGVLLGGACLLFYCYRLNYFPVGLSIGDGFLLILLATSFGSIYGLFVISLAALGLWLTPILRPIQKLVFSMRKRFSRRQPEKPLELVSPNWVAGIFGFFGLIFIAAISRGEPLAILTLSATSFLLGLLVAAYQDTALKLSEVMKKEATRILPLANESQALHLDKERLKIQRTLLLIAFVITPLVVGGVSGVLLDLSMRFANIKKGPSYVMLRAPYSTFVPSRFQAKQSPQALDYITFEGVDVMFSGMGQKSVIEFKNDKKVQRLEIPNESIIVVPR